jgi:hypothetical protein
VLMAHAVCMSCGVKGNDNQHHHQHQHQPSDDSDIPELRRRQERLLVKIPLGRTVLLGAWYQSMLWHSNLCFQLCGLGSIRMQLDHLFCGSELNSLYYRFYRHILTQRGALHGPWSERQSVRLFAESFVRDTLFASHTDARAMFDVLLSYCMGWAGGGLECVFRNHFPDDFLKEKSVPSFGLRSSSCGIESTSKSSTSTATIVGKTEREKYNGNSSANSFAVLRTLEAAD